MRYVRLSLIMMLSSLLVAPAVLGQSQPQAQPQPQAQSQSQSPKSTCGPDHAIIYKRAVSLLNQAEKKLSGRYTAEAKALVKEANSLFTILVKECGESQKERLLTEKETEQEAINQKMSADALAQSERLMQSAVAKEKKSDEADKQGNKDLALQYQRQAKGEYELAHTMSIKAGLYALRNQQMLFQFLTR